MENKFIHLADMPPDPRDKAALEHYKQMGFQVCLLTEDDVKLVSNGTVSEDYKAAIRSICDCGMQVWIRNMFNDADYFECDTDKEGSNYGSPYQMEPRHITDEFAAFPGVTGFYMADEAYMYTLPEKINIEWMRPDCPQYASFDKLTKLVDWKNRYYPQAFFHMNHVPSQSWDHYLPKDDCVYDYEDFLNAYVQVILKRLKGGPRSLCVDNYPLIGENYIEKDYLFDLMTAAKVTRQYNALAAPGEKATFGICLQTFHVKAMHDDRHRDITMPEEVSFQMYVGMALGARLFEYFCYRSYLQEMLGIMAPGGQDRIYEIVKTGSDRASCLEPVLSSYDNVGSYMVPGSLLSFNTAAIVMAQNLFCQPFELRVCSDYDTLVGCFTGENQKGYLLVNYTDPIRRCTGKVVLEGSVHRLRVYQGENETVLCAQDGRFTLTLAPGDAAFAVWES